jgi:hypothetical protein
MPVGASRAVCLVIMKVGTEILVTVSLGQNAVSEACDAGGFRRTEELARLVLLLSYCNATSSTVQFEISPPQLLYELSYADHIENPLVPFMVRRDIIWLLSER